ncbi:MAG: hypothetical protein AB7O98_19600 [Hyphomonadaceae bacterium]
MLRICAVATIFALSTAAADPLPQRLDVVHGAIVELSGVDIAETARGAEVSGWARRTPGRFGRIRAHVRIEAFDAAGVSLGAAVTHWNGALSVRDRSSARFTALLPSAAADAALVRVVVVDAAD